MSLHHNHNHEHSHDHNDKSKKLSLNEKLPSLLNHWIDHNVSHKASYLSWAEKAENENLETLVSCLKEVAGLSDKINIKLKKALDSLTRD